MSDYTKQEIENAMNDADGWSEFHYLSNGALESMELRGEHVDAEKVASYGGEGYGDEIWVVLKVGDQLFRKEGFYASDYGSDWDGDCYEVRAVERPTTYYEAI